MSYETIWDFCKDLARLIDEGATLRTLYDAMLTVERENLGELDTSPSRMRTLAETWTQRPNFAFIRLTELFGGAEIEHSDDYVLAMIGSLGGRHEQEVRLFLLRQDHDLRDTVFWRIFEVEGGGEISLANIDKFSRDEFNWHNTVVLLTNEGTLDRARVLRSCLEALNRDFSAYRAGWFSRVYAALDPSPAEAAVDQHLLRLGLASPITATVSLAVKQLAAVHKAGLLDAAAFVEACAPALAGPKGAATTVLRMLASLAGQSDLAGVPEAMEQALEHPHADVQRAAAQALLKLDRRDLVERARESLAPAVAAELLGASPADVGEMRPVTASVPQAEAVRPWSDQDALERFAALIEVPTDAIEFELALAWLGATERAAEILHPLQKRASKIGADDVRFWLASLVVAAGDPEFEFLPQRFWQRTDTQLVNGEWVTIPVGDPEPRPTEEQATVLPSLVTRLRDVAAIVQGRTPRRPLLATPTDTHGWIDADVLLERLAAVAAEGLAVPLVDITQAILRVRAEDRARVILAAGVEPPVVTESVRVEWLSHGSETLKADGSPQWVWWNPVIHGDSAHEPSAVQPGVIASNTVSRYGGVREASDLVIAELALVNPASTLWLVAVGARILNSALDEDAEHRAIPVLAALAAHPGAWSAQTVQLVALGMAAKRAEVRSHAAELFAQAIPTRVDATEVAEGFAACAPVVVSARWAQSFSDAASLAPDSVIDVLTLLLPRLERTTRGIGTLLVVLLDESLRQGRTISDAQVRSWLGAFAGSSSAAKSAKALLAL